MRQRIGDALVGALIGFTLAYFVLHIAVRQLCGG